MKANETATVSTEFVNDPDAFIKLCNSPRQNRLRREQAKKDRIKEMTVQTFYEMLLAVGIALIIVAIIK